MHKTPASGLQTLAKFRLLVAAALTLLFAESGFAQTVSFRSAARFPSGLNAFSLAVGDLNGDGRPDLVVASPGNNLGVNNTISVLLADGPGSFGPPTAIAVGDGPAAVAAADLNGDGKLDVAVAHYYGGHAEDADGDGDLDLVLHFRTRDTGVVCGVTSATLTGRTFGGQGVRGTDSTSPVGCG